MTALVALVVLLLRPRDRDARGRLRTVGGREVVSEGTHDHAPGQRADHWDDDVQACARDHEVGPQAVAERDQDRVALGSAHAIERHEQVGALASRTELADRPEPGRSRRSVAGDDELAWPAACGLKITGWSFTVAIATIWRMPAGSGVLVNSSVPWGRSVAAICRSTPLPR